MRSSDFEIHNTGKLDTVLRKLIDMIIYGQSVDSDFFGLVASCIIDNQNRVVCGINYAAPDGRRVHAERAAIDRYRKLYGEPEPGCICVTTLSPCDRHMDERYGESCLDLINQTNIHKVYCGYLDHTQTQWPEKTFSLKQTRNPGLKAYCKIIASRFLD